MSLATYSPTEQRYTFYGSIIVRVLIEGGRLINIYTLCCGISVIIMKESSLHYNNNTRKEGMAKGRKGKKVAIGM